MQTRLMQSRLKTISLAVPIVIAIVFTGCAKSPEAAAKQHMDRGAERLARRDFKHAIIEYKIASQNNPKDTEPLYQLGLVSLTVHDGRGMLNAFEKVLALNPNHPGALYQIARMKAESSQPETLRDSVAMLQKLLAIRPGDAQAMYALALVELKLGDSAAARQHYEAAVSTSTGKLDGKLDDIRAVIAEAAHRGDKALVKFMVDLATAKMPKSADMALLAAQAALMGGDKVAAGQELTRALSLNPQLRAALELQVQLAAITGRPEAAEETARQLAALPGAETRTAYAEVLLAHHKGDLAIQEYQKLRGRFPNDPTLEQHYVNAMLQLGMKAQARAELDHGIAKDAKRADLLLERARLNLDENRIAEAGRDLVAVETLDAWDESAAIEKARYLDARGEKMEEGNLLNETLRQNPRAIQARLQLSRLLSEAGKPDAALQVLDGATGQEQGTPEYKMYRNATLMAAGQWDEAAKNIAEALKAARTADNLVQDAALRIHNKDVAGARKTLDEALNLNPGDARALGEMTSVFMMKNQAREYLAWMEQHAEGNPTNAGLQIYAARVLRSARNFGACRRDLNRALATPGYESKANLELATLDIVEEKLDEAKARLEAELRKGDSSETRTLMADIFVRRQDWKHAEEHLKAALAVAPGNPVTLMNLAAVISKNTKRAPEALPLAEKALALSPGNASIESAGGWFYYETGRYQQAIPHLEASLRSSDIAATRYRLAAACLKAGDQTCATTQYELALQRNPNDPERSAVEPLLRNR